MIMTLMIHEDNYYDDDSDGGGDINDEIRETTQTKRQKN